MSIHIIMIIIPLIIIILIIITLLAFRQVSQMLRPGRMESVWSASGKRRRMSRKKYKKSYS